MAKFDLFELKKKVDAERALTAKKTKETIGQKILMVLVTVISLTIIYSLILTFNLPPTINYLILFVFSVLVSLRIIQISKRKI